MAELAVAGKLIKLGYTVSKPLNEDSYDLIAELGGKLHRIQVKSATLKPRRGSYLCCLSHGRGKVIRYTKEQCDFIVMFAPYRSDFPDIFEDGYYVVPISVGANYSSATLFPPGKGRGNIKVCKWEEYRNGWERLQE